MKRFYSMLLALGIASASMLAQTVTVFMKDNTVHKYNAEYLSKIAVRDATPSPDAVDFKTIDLDVYSGGNVTVTMKNETEDVVCTVDLYGSTDALYLQAGVYNVEGTRQPFTVDPAYSKISIDGEDSKPAAGTVQVSIGQPSNSPVFRETADSHVYTINVDIELANGKTLKGKFVGELPTYTPWINAQLKDASYLALPQPDGQYYVKFNDANWKYELAMVFMADESGDSLPEGTYNYSEIATPGSLLAASYVDGYSPNFNCKLLPGSRVIVSKDGDTYHIDMELLLNDGREATFTFDGNISGTPSFNVADPIDISVASMGMHVWGSSNVTLYFYNEDSSQTLDLDTYLPYGTSYLPTGVYSIGGTVEPYVDTSIAYTYYSETDADGTTVKTGLKSGTLTVTRDGVVYTFVLDAYLDDAESTPIRMTYTGTLPDFGPEINLTMSAAQYNENPQPKGSFYVMFHDASSSCEMAIHFWSYPYADKLFGYPDVDTYEFVDAATGAPFQFTNDSYVDLFTPYSHNRLTEGSKIYVSGDNGDPTTYNIQMDLIFEDGRIAHISYNGQITGTPTFADPTPQPTPITVDAKTLQMDVYGGGTNITLTFFSENNAQKVALDSYLPDGVTYLPTGVYTIGGSEKPYIDLNPTYTNFSEDGSSTPFKSGTLTVTREGGVYTFVLDAVLNDAESSQIGMTYTGTLPDFSPEINLTMSGAEYNENPRPKGSFYVKFHDASYSCEMAIHFWSYPYADKLFGYPDVDTYEFVDAATGAPFQFTNDSYVALYNPNSHNFLTEGSKIYVSGDNGDPTTYNIQMDLIFEDGRIAHISYNGQITGTPTFL